MSSASSSKPFNTTTTDDGNNTNDVTKSLLSVLKEEPLATINITFPAIEKKPSLLNSLLNFASNKYVDQMTDTAPFTNGKTTVKTNATTYDVNTINTDSIPLNNTNYSKLKTILNKKNMSSNVGTKNVTTTGYMSASNNKSLFNIALFGDPNVPAYSSMDTTNGTMGPSSKMLLTCYNDTTSGIIKCRNKVSTPHGTTTTFSGDIGVTETGKKGKKKLGGETTKASNETLNFKIGNSTYDFQNLTSLHNCSGCLKGKNLIKHNKTVPVEKRKNSTLNSTRLEKENTRGEKNKSLNNSEEYIRNSTGYFKAKGNKTAITLGINSKDRNSTAVENIKQNETSAANDTSFDWENKLFRRRCEDIPVSSNTLDHEMFKSQHTNRIPGLFINCVTKRRLVSNRVTNTKTKKNGKLVSDKTKDEREEKKKKNGERAQSNEERANSNNERVHQSEENDRSNKEKSLANEKVLQEILRGDHGKPAAKITEEESRNFENLTAKLDPSMIQNNQIIKPLPTVDHKDDDVGMIGIDSRPAIEEEQKPKNKTKKEKEKVSKEKNPEKSGKSTDKDKNGNKTEKESKANSEKPLTNQKQNKTKSESNIMDTNNTTTNNTLKQNSTNTDSLKNNTSSEANKTINDDLYQEDKPIKSILAFGDSLTKGLYGQGQYNPYTYHLKEELEKVSKQKYTLYNEGENGECACGAMTKRLPITLDKYNDTKKTIDLVIILAGTNDLLRNNCSKRCDLFQGIKTLHKIVHERGLKSVVTTIMETTIGTNKMTDEQYQDALSDVNQNLRGFSRENRDMMILCDLADEFPRKSKLSIDKVHPTKEGYDVIAEIIYDCIKDFKY